MEVQATFVVAGYVLEAEGNLLALVFFPISFSLKPHVLQGVAVGAEHGNRMVGRRVVHLQAGKMYVALIPCAVVATLRRCQEVVAEGAIGSVYHIAHGTVVCTAGVGVVYLDCDYIDGDRVFGNADFLHCE